LRMFQQVRRTAALTLRRGRHAKYWSGLAVALCAGAWAGFGHAHHARGRHARLPRWPAPAPGERVLDQAPRPGDGTRATAARRSRAVWVGRGRVEWLS